MNVCLQSLVENLSQVSSILEGQHLPHEDSSLDTMPPDPLSNPLTPQHQTPSPHSTDPPHPTAPAPSLHTSAHTVESLLQLPKVPCAGFVCNMHRCSSQRVQALESQHSLIV